MTLRLVALMSVVLLLSLAAVGLLVTHYQQQLMEEVRTTASQVGQAALRTLEWTGCGESHARLGVARRRHGPSEAPPAETHDVVLLEPDPVPAGPSVERVKHIVTTSTEDQEFTISEQLIYPAEAFPSALPGTAFEKEFQACLASRLGTAAHAKRKVMIQIEAVRAETDPSGNIVLAIPKLTQADEADGATAGAAGPGLARYEVEVPPGPAAPNVFFARGEEIRLPIGGDYENLFARLRNRSLFLFMGVFLVGLALSTGLASRFTRPIRKLDTGIRRLSQGDLDVEVDAGGKGEIGRLARAFNEMAGKLRTNRERERELVRREKLSALGRLAAGVAHDVRNPLHSIGLTLQHLSEAARPEGADRLHEFERSVDVIRGEIRRLDQLVGNFLRFAKSERRARRPVDLAQLARDTLRLVEKESERRGVRVDLVVGEPLPAVHADADAIRSAILNLILNSFEAMPGGGRLALALTAEGDEVVLEVSDTGQGIPEDEQRHVFDFAYTTREAGTGLGLAMVHHCVVEEHGGRVSLASRPGEGTRVHLRLPAHVETAA